MEFVGTAAGEENNLRTLFSKIADLNPHMPSKHFFPHHAPALPGLSSLSGVSRQRLSSMRGSPTPASWLSGLPRLTCAEGIPGLQVAVLLSSVHYVCRYPSRTIICGPLATNRYDVSCQGYSVFKQWTWIDEYDHWPTSAKFDRKLNFSGTTSVDHSHVRTPLSSSSSSFLPHLPCSAAPGPAVRVPREWLLACGEGSEFA